MDITNIKFYNTLTRRKEDFIPIKKGYVSMYACGPTVYDYAHIGNFRTYIFEDVLNRVLKYNNLEVTYVQNVTDVGHLVGDGDTGEDKIEKGSRERGKTAQDIALFFTEAYIKDSQKLNILPPSILVRATEHINEQIEMIKVLEQKGFTYQTSDGIYFDTSKLKDYGKLARLKIEGLKEGARIESSSEKINLTDFSLWKFSIPKNISAEEAQKMPKRQMEWDSPWSVGFPGWHIECSAMSTKYLGDHFDIHCGGTDFIPLHHTNEIAQNEAVYDQKTVNYWLHGGFLMVDGGKMSKSLKNTYTISDIESKNIDPLSFRYFIYSAHYRQPMNFTWQALSSADESYKNLIDRLSAFAENVDLVKLEVLDTKSNIRVDHWRDLFMKAINDDMNMPKAMAVVHELIKDPGLTESEKISLVLNFDKILGLKIKEKISLKIMMDSNVPSEVIDLAEARETARKDGNWNEADRLRKNIRDMGYEIKDSEKGYKVNKLNRDLLD